MNGIVCDDGRMLISGLTTARYSLQEIELLHQRFPHHIQLYVACKDNMVLGGTVLYLTPNVVHTQYISASPEGKQLLLML